jgi:hypothetical protein
MTVLDIIYLAKELEEKANKQPELFEKEIRFASQPDYPFEYSIQTDFFESNDAFYFCEDKLVKKLNSDLKYKMFF